MMITTADIITHDFQVKGKGTDISLYIMNITSSTTSSLAPCLINTSMASLCPRSTAL